MYSARSIDDHTNALAYNTLQICMWSKECIESASKMWANSKFVKDIEERIVTLYKSSVFRMCKCRLSIKEWTTKLLEYSINIPHKDWLTSVTVHISARLWQLRATYPWNYNFGRTTLCQSGGPLSVTHKGSCGSAITIYKDIIQVLTRCSHRCTNKNPCEHKTRMHKQKCIITHSDTYGNKC